MSRTQTTQATAKRWKAIQGMGCLSTLAGLVAIGVGISAAPTATRGDAQGAAIGILLVAGGFTAWLLGRLGGWWFHG